MFFDGEFLTEITPDLDVVNVSRCEISSLTNQKSSNFSHGKISPMCLEASLPLSNPCPGLHVGCLRGEWVQKLSWGMENSRNTWRFCGVEVVLFGVFFLGVAGISVRIHGEYITEFSLFNQLKYPP